MSADRNPEGVHIPMADLSEEALDAIVLEFVTRDGTEHTETAKKHAQVMARL
ncbi:MAG: YheU family protein [Planctomycetota bacterium]